MAKQEIEKVEKREVNYRIYSDSELRNFHDKVQKYYSDYTLATGEVIQVIDKKKLMVDFGATTPWGATIVDEVSLPPNRLQHFENVYEQWQKWKARVGIDKGSYQFKNLQGLAKMAGEGSESGLWKCYKCEFEGSLKEVQDHQATCRVGVKTLEPIPEEIPF